MRLNKFISACGVCSRRKADELISENRIKVNGKLINTLGYDVDEDNDKVYFDDKLLTIKKKHNYFVLNKPVGYTCSNKDDYNDKLAIELIDFKDHIANVGRLDKDSEGLVIFTDDGEFNYRMTHPKFNIWKEYKVYLDKPLHENDKILLEEGVYIDNKKTLPCKLNKINDKCYKIRIREGRNRQIRLMFDSLGYDVVRLIRLSHGEIKLSNLKTGESRRFNNKELEYVERLNNERPKEL